MVRTAVIVLGVLLHPENDAIRNFNELYLAGAMDALTAYNTAALIKLFCKEGELVSHEEAAHLIFGLGQ